MIGFNRLPTKPLPWMMSYAQQTEDVILRRGLIDVKVGFYVDIGAGKPTDSSVTRYFYDKGWRGINIEPQHNLIIELEDERPEDINLELAVGSNAGQLELTTYPSSWGLATSDETFRQINEARGLDSNIIKVEAKPLEDILSEYAPNQHINFLKIDVEGSEQVVLESLDLKRWRPDIIVAEATLPVSPDACWDWEGILLNAGYRLGLFDGLNRYYAYDKTILDRIAVPANIYDRYMQYKWWRLMKRDGQLQIKEENNLGDDFPLSEPSRTHFYTVNHYR